MATRPRVLLVVGYLHAITSTVTTSKTVNKNGIKIMLVLFMKVIVIQPVIATMVGSPL